MSGSYEVPDLERRCVCVTSDFVLGALVSSMSNLPGRYFPLFEFPLVDADTQPNSVEAIRARIRTTRINNAIARLQPDSIVLAGLNPTQSAMFAFLPSRRLITITIHSQAELGAAHRSLSPIKEGILRCAPIDLAPGLVRAARLGTKLVCDTTATPLEPDGSSNADGIIVAERTGDLSDVIAANYAIAVQADFELVEPFDRRDSDRINSLLVEWGETRSAPARSELVKTVSDRLTSIDLTRYQYATFFTRGLPYGFALDNIIPISHVLSGVQDDLFIFNNILVERSKNFFGSAIVFSPGSFEHEETKDVIQQLRTNKHIVCELTGDDATPGNLDTYASLYPYDILHICSHGGESEGYHCVREFEDRYGALHRVEFDEVVAFYPLLTDRGKVSVTIKAFPRRIDGYAWMSPELRAANLPTYLFEDLWAAIQDDMVQPSRTPAKAAIAGSCCIVCTKGIHQGTFQRLASDHFPLVFNNSCLSWEEIAASFIDAGCRGYIGTLWSVGNDTAREAARRFYEQCWSQPIITAFRDMSKAIGVLADRDIYFFWGLHFASICPREMAANDRICAELMRAAADWANKLRRQDFPPHIRAKCLESFHKILGLLAAEPGMGEFVDRWYRDRVNTKPPTDGNDESSNRRSIEISGDAAQLGLPKLGRSASEI
jgi:hypothetical protein